MRAPGPYRTRPRRPRLSGLARDLPLKAIAVVVALVLWATVGLGAVREDTVEFDGRIAIERPELPEGYVLRGQLPDVAVRLRGTPPALATVAREHIRATIEISLVAAARGEPQDAPVRVTLASESVKVVGADPASVSVRVEPIVSRQFAVQARFANDPPSGFVRGDASLTPAEVSVTGPQSLLATVTAVYATVRFGDAGIDLTQTVQAMSVDQSGAAVEGVVAEPAAIAVRVPVLPTSTTRTVPVLFTVRGSVAAGHWITRITSEPVAVTVRGDPAALARLERLETEPVDVGGLTAARTVRVPLVLPAGVTLLEPTDATVAVTVAPLTGTRPFPLIAIQAQGVAPTQMAELDPRTVEVVLSGTVAALAAVNATDVVATVDVSGRAAGTHQLDVAVRAPNGVTITTVQPLRVAVTIKDR